MAGFAETICAIASGAPPSAIALIRLSGPGVRDIARSCLSGGLPKPRYATLDSLLADDGSVIDQGLAIFMPGPYSYTGEDVLELSLHGGRIVADLALNRLIEAGARLAERGEFTRRAFEAGKLDLTQAEAVADLIEAESKGQHQLAVRQLDGALSDVYENWRSELTEVLALLEATIDFPDEDDAPETVFQPASDRISALLLSFERALAAGNFTERLRDGFRVALLGKPNAGKSTLLNRFAGRDAAIVTDIPGTTRDVVEVRLTVGPFLVWLSDTAGLRETVDPIESEGVRRAQAIAETADVRIWVLDGSDPADVPDDIVGPGDLVVFNKSDLGEAKSVVPRETIFVSAKSGSGFDHLLSSLEEALGNLGNVGEAPLLTRARHRQGIKAAQEYLKRAKAGLETGIGSEIVSEDVRAAAFELSSLTGAVDVEDVLGAVFSSFCIGK